MIGTEENLVDIPPAVGLEKPYDVSRYRELMVRLSPMQELGQEHVSKDGGDQVQYPWLGSDPSKMRDHPHLG